MCERVWWNQGRNHSVGKNGTFVTAVGERNHVPHAFIVMCSSILIIRLSSLEELFLPQLDSPHTWPLPGSHHVLNSPVHGENNSLIIKLKHQETCMKSKEIKKCFVCCLLSFCGVWITYSLSHECPICAVSIFQHLQMFYICSYLGWRKKIPGTQLPFSCACKQYRSMGTSLTRLTITEGSNAHCCC